MLPEKIYISINNIIWLVNSVNYQVLNSFTVHNNLKQALKLHFKINLIAKSKSFYFQQ